MEKCGILGHWCVTSRSLVVAALKPCSLSHLGLFLWPPRTFSPPFSPLSPSQVLGRLVSRSQAGCHSQSLWPVSLWPASSCHSVPLTCGGLSHMGNLSSLLLHTKTHSSLLCGWWWWPGWGKQLFFYCFGFLFFLQKILFKNCFQSQNIYPTLWKSQGLKLCSQMSALAKDTF